MNGAIAPFSTQMQHEKAKYRKAANSVGPWPDAQEGLEAGHGSLNAKCRGAAGERAVSSGGVGAGVAGGAQPAALSGCARRLAVPERGVRSLRASPKRCFVTPRAIIHARGCARTCSFGTAYAVHRVACIATVTRLLVVLLLEVTRPLRRPTCALASGRGRRSVARAPAAQLVRADRGVGTGQVVIWLPAQVPGPRSTRCRLVGPAAVRREPVSRSAVDDADRTRSWRRSASTPGRRSTRMRRPALRCAAGASRKRAGSARAHCAASSARCARASTSASGSTAPRAC